MTQANNTYGSSLIALYSCPSHCRHRTMPWRPSGMKLSVLAQNPFSTASPMEQLLLLPCAIQACRVMGHRGRPTVQQRARRRRRLCQRISFRGSKTPSYTTPSRTSPVSSHLCTMSGACRACLAPAATETTIGSTGESAWSKSWHRQSTDSPKEIERRLLV